MTVTACSIPAGRPRATLTSMRPSYAAATSSRLASMTARPRLPKNRPRRSPTAASSSSRSKPRSGREGRDPQEDARQARRPASAARGPARGASAGQACRVERGDADPRRRISSARAVVGIDRPDRSGIGQLATGGRASRHRPARPAGSPDRMPRRHGAGPGRPDRAPRACGSARRRSSGSRSSAGPSSRSRSADRPGRTCRRPRRRSSR